MRLTRLHVDGLKILEDVRLTVPPRLAISGPNGAGKTALLEAVQIALFGGVPQAGRRTPAATREVQAPTAQAIELTLAFDTGFALRRTIGSKTTLKVEPPRGERTVAQGEARIALETGLFIPSFSLADFLGLSAEKKLEALFEILPRVPGPLARERFNQALGYAERPETVQKAIDYLWDKIVEPAGTPRDGLAHALQYVHERYLAADSDRKAAVRAVELEERAAPDSQLVPPDPARIEQLEAEHREALQRVGELRSQERAAAAAAQGRQARAQRAQAIERERAEIATRRRLVNQDLAGATPPTDLAIAAVRTELEYWQAELTHAEEHARGREQALLTRSRELTECQQKVKALAEGDGRCPVCGGSEQIEHARAHYAAEERQLQEAVAGFREDLDKWALEIRARERRRDEFERRVTTMEEAAEHVATSRAWIGDARVRWDELTAELEQNLVAEDADLPAPVSGELETADTVARQIEAGIREERERARAVADAEARGRMLQEHRAAVVGHSERAGHLKAVLAGLRTLRNETITEQLRPIESAATEILGAVFPDRVFRFDWGQDLAGFDFGFESPTGFRSFRAASNGEDMLLATAFVAGLVQAVNPPWRAVLIDNLEAVDPVNRRALLEILAGLGDRLDNVLVAGCCELEAPGWEVLELGVRAEAAA